MINPRVINKSNTKTKSFTLIDIKVPGKGNKINSSISKTTKITAIIKN